MSIASRLPPAPNVATRVLTWSGRVWFAVAFVGQLAFIGYILAFYGVRTLNGDYAGWNDKPLIDGHIAGDHIGNVVFAAHVLLASVMTLCGLLQLMPALRSGRPRLHRWTGRTFIGLAVVLTLTGMWLTLVRGTSLSTVSSVAVLLNGVLILAFAALAWRAALRRRFEDHRRWAMRTFMVASGVWFLRVGIMGWVLINKGPVGMDGSLSGPTDVVLVFGSYLIPLLVLELHFAAWRGSSTVLRAAVALILTASLLFTAAGVFGTIAFMWLPHL